MGKHNLNGYHCEHCGEAVQPEGVQPSIRAAKMKDGRPTIVLVLTFDDHGHQLMVDLGIENCNRLMTQALLAVTFLETFEHMS